ncbi:hypothetical protein KXS11_05570 [Plantibacter flavus]|uniref:hypothetical protein n=1 Tax=Plantibacter flavus TaxID=150123 RepID=UPI003F1829FC
MAAVLFGMVAPGSVIAASGAARTAVDPAECVVDVPGGSRCGELTVPVSRGVPDSPTATLPYVIVPAALDTGRPPIVYLSGGVPLSDVDVTALAVQRGLAADRDVVFVERRGGADASPSLECAPAVDAFVAALSTAEDRAAAVESITTALTSCSATWQEDGVTASDFGVAPSAFDLRALREQLGYRSWTVMAVGTSAGIALAAPGVDPEGVVGIVVDGPDLGAPGIVSASGVAAALAVVQGRGDDPAMTDADVSTGAPAPATSAAQAAGAEGGAPRESGDAEAVAAASALDRSATTLAEAAAVFEGEPHTTAGPGGVTVGADAFLAIAARALADPTTQAALPLALASVVDGRQDAVDALTDEVLSSIRESGPVQDWALACSTVGWPGTTETAAPETADTEATTTTLLEDVSAGTCTALGIAPTPAPAAVDLPALVLSAPEQDAAVLGSASASLPQATAASFPGAGAVPTASSGCAVIAVANWLSDPASYRAALCAVDDAAVAVVGAGDVSASPRWVQQTTTGTGGWWLLLVLPALFGIVALAWSIAWAYRLIAQALRREPVQAGLTLGIAPVFGASWAIAGAVILVRSAETSPATHLLGLPAALPWLSIALLVSCIGLIPVWQGAHRGSRLRITAVSLLWGATAVWNIVYVLGWW